jgi:CRP-like cAMP-binding protein
VPKWAIALDVLSLDERALLRGRMHEQSLPARTMVFRQGDPSDQLIVLNEGRIRIFQTSDQGDDFTHGICVGGSTIGLSALILGRPRDTSAETLDRVSILTLAKDEFQQFMYTMPAFGAGLAKLLSTMAVENYARSGSFAQESARTRLARNLLLLAQPLEGKRSTEIHCVSGITQEDLARMLGVSRTWVVLMLGDLSTRGLIVRDRRRILIPSTQKLADYIAEIVEGPEGS